MKFSIVLVVLSLVACVLAKGNSSAKLECHSISKGNLKLAGTKNNHTKLVGNVNVNSTATVNGLGSGLLAKSDKPLHAEIFKCNHYPKTEQEDGPYVQVRADGKCATVVHGGFGVEFGVQLASCAQNLTDDREQWFGAPAHIPGDNHTYTLVPIDIKNHGYGFLSMGIVSSFFDALAFSLNGLKNDNITELSLVFDAN